MRKIVSLLAVAGLAAGLSVALTAPAGASVGAKTSKFCKALNDFDTNELGNPTSEEDAAAYAKQLKKLQKSAKGKTKATVGDLVDAYDELADGERFEDVFSQEKFARALGNFGLAIVKCGLSSIPDITLPDDINLPDITLPDLGS